MKNSSRIIKSVFAIMAIFVFMIPLISYAEEQPVVIDVSTAWTSGTGQNIYISNEGYRIGENSSYTSFEKLVITGTSTTNSNLIHIQGMPSGATLTFKDLNITESDSNAVLNIAYGVTIGMEGDVSLNSTTDANTTTYAVNVVTGNKLVFDGAADLTITSLHGLSVYGSMDVKNANNITISSETYSAPAYWVLDATTVSLEATGDINIKGNYMAMGGSNEYSVMSLKGNNVYIKSDNMDDNFSKSPAINIVTTINATNKAEIVNEGFMINARGINIQAGGNVLLSGTASNGANVSSDSITINTSGDVTIDGGNGKFYKYGSEAIVIDSANNVAIKSNSDTMTIDGSVSIEAAGDVKIINENSDETKDAYVAQGNLYIEAGGDVLVSGMGTKSMVSGYISIDANDVSLLSNSKITDSYVTYYRENGEKYYVFTMDDSVVNSLAVKDGSDNYYSNSLTEKAIYIKNHQCEKDDSKYITDDNNHWYGCNLSNCDSIFDLKAHDYSIESDADKHWEICKCGLKKNETSHLDNDADEKCDVCLATVPTTESSTEVTTQATTQATTATTTATTAASTEAISTVTTEVGTEITTVATTQASTGSMTDQENTTTENTTETVNDDNAPTTGDGFNMAFYITLMLASAFMVTTLHVKKNNARE